MKILDLHRLGAGLLAAGPLLIQLGGNKEAWWIGMVFTVLGPILMALKRTNK